MISPLPQVGIRNANTRPISRSFGPFVMRGAISGLSRSLSLAKVTQKIVDGRVEEVETPLVTQGVIQPLGLRELELKPEGERSWQWYTIHATTDLVLQTEDVVGYNGERYRVMNTGGYSDYGFVKYEVVKSYGAAR